MATSRPERRPARAVVVAAAAAIGLALSSGTGFAAPDTPAEGGDQAQTSAAQPQTSAQAAQQVGEMNHQLEIVTEQFNDARIITRQRQNEAAEADRQLALTRAQITDLDASVRQLAADAYTGDQAVGFTVLMTSGSPQEFLDRLNTLDSIAGYNSDTLRQFTAAQQRAADLAAQAAAAQAAAVAAEADVQAKKTTIETDLPVLEALMATLTTQEREAALARAHEVAADDATASRGGSREPSEAASPDAPVPPSSRVSAPTQAAQIAVDTALAQVGDPYVWGGGGPDTFDCSGLTSYAYAAAGINLPHSSSMQATMGQYVPRDQLQPGDLVFFYSPVSHVGMYIGNGEMVHAPNSGGSVSIMNIDSAGWDYN
ncbi:MAG: C40 family peptidase, partial [Geodermatophilaceae bacterium]|nr:C40 family peptidase [Geodermatophilaceae bacterium]